MLMQAVYLDYQASAPIDPKVRLAMSEAYDAPGNASSEEHGFGWAAAARVEQARKAVADSVRALPEEVTFTSGATEANNIAILGAALAAPVTRRRILISSIEHKSVSAAAFAAERWGFTVEIVPVTRDGSVDPADLRSRLSDDVAIASIMAVNNEIGTIQPVAELGRLTRAVGAFFHVDATQALAALDVDMIEWGADALSLSGHKVHGPGGVGALVVGIDAPWRPLPIMHGGGQEQGLRPGTLPVPLCVGLGEACRLMALAGQGGRLRVAELRDLLGDRLKLAAPDLEVSCEAVARHPGCLHVRLPGVSASDLLLRLQPHVAAATGSACTSGMIGPSHVLLALGMTPEQAGECLRFSVGRFSTREDVEFAADCVSSSLRGGRLVRSRPTDIDVLSA
jgi:cysteine desulfurase